MQQVSNGVPFIWAGVVFIIFFLIAVVSANMILYKKNDTGVTKRRIWFWVLAALTFVVSFLINWGVAESIEVVSQKSKYITFSWISAVCATALYVLVGFIVSRIFSSSKVGKWF